MSNCDAVREGDEMFCAKCRLRWDAGEDRPVDTPCDRKLTPTSPQPPPVIQHAARLRAESGVMMKSLLDMIQRHERDAAEHSNAAREATQKKIEATNALKDMMERGEMVVCGDQLITINAQGGICVQSVRVLPLL